MALPDTSTRTLSEIRAQLLSGSLTASDLAEAYLARIEEKDKDIHAFLEVFDTVRADAKAADARLKAEGEKSPVLCGIPVALKDNILVSGKHTGAASKILSGYTATYDATIVSKLKEAGAIMLGHTNMDEFAMGGSTENSAYGPTKNPLDLSRVPGGSSGGSAAAVAMGAAPVAIGTDTGGSIRQPASFCGIVGLKPTYGAVSRHGLVAMGSSLDQAGPLTRSVADAETLFNIIRGKDAYDATTFGEGVYPQKERKDSYVIGVPRAFLEEGLNPDVRERFFEGLEVLKAKGHTLVDIELPNIARSLAAYYIVMPAEVSSNLARYDGMRFGLSREAADLLATYRTTRGEGFGPEVRRRILLGTYVLSSGYYDSYYGTAQRVRKIVRDECAEAFKSVDAIMFPTTPSPAFRIGEKADPLSMYLEDIYTVPANMTGLPAISVPGGTVDRDGVALPTGIQALAPHANEHILFDIGRALYGQ